MLFGRNDVNTEQQDVKEASTCENELGSPEVGEAVPVDCYQYFSWLKDAVCWG